MFYRFPRSRVAIAAIPKTGCTSVLTFLVNLESRLGSTEDATQSDRAAAAPPAADGRPAETTTIHGDHRLKRFVVGEKTPSAEGELRLATVRDPADRIASCWLDKVVDGPSAWQAKYHTEAWFPQDFRTPDAIEASFLAFLSALQRDQALLRSDPHWAPQSWMLRHWQGARCVMTEVLDDLPRFIIERLDNPSGMLTEPMPHMHRTEGWLKQFVLTPRTQSLIGELYGDDYDMLEDRCGTSSSSRHATRAGFDAADALRLPGFDRKVHMRRTRRLSQSLAAILDSAIWRRLFRNHE